MSRYTNSIILLTILNSAHIYTKYFHHKLIGNIKSSQIKFSIHTLNFEGIVLFGRDFNNRLLIKFERTYYFGQIIIFYYNDNSANLTIKDLCGCTDCDKKHLVFYLNFNNNSSVQCNKQTSLNLNFHKSIERKNRFFGYPEPAFNKNNSKNLFIWMGNIGLYLGENDKKFYPCKDQLRGCLEYFSFNNNHLNTNKTGNLFLSSCESYEMTEYFNNIPEKNIRANLFDCSLSVVDVRYCKNDLALYNGKHQTFEYFNFSNKHIEFTLKWKQFDLKNFCLLEIKKRNGSILLFTINESFHIVKHTKINNNHEDEVLNKIEDYKNIIIINFQSSFYTVKIISGHDIYLHKFEDFDEPYLINVGKSTFMNSCLQYEGAYDFQYNYSQFRRSPSKFVSKEKRFVNKNDVYYILVLSVGIMIIILLILNLFSCKKKPMKADSNSNVYENQFDQEGIATSLRLRNSDVYEIINEHIA